MEIVPEWKRVYPYAPHAATSSGTWVRSPRTRDDEFQAAGYLLNERVGQFGVEKSMESVLHGTWGEQVYEVDAANRPVRLIEEVPPINGFDIAAHDRPRLPAVRRAGARDHARGAPHPARSRTRRSKKPNGKIEKMDIDIRRRGAVQGAGRLGDRDGLHRRQIIAMASYPTFDNRWFEAGLSSDKFQQIFPSINPDGDARSTPTSRSSSTVPSRVATTWVRRSSRSRRSPPSTPGCCHRATTTRTRARTGATSRSSSDRCAPGLVRCEYKNATCAGTQQAVPVRVRQRRRRAGGVVRRVLLPHRRADHAPQRRQARCCRSRFASSGSAPTPGSSCRSSSTARCPTEALKAALRRPRCDQRRRGPVATSSATTSSWRSARACCRPRRCSSPSGTPRSPTAASCCSPRSCRRSGTRACPTAHDRLRRLLARARLRETATTPVLVRQIPMPAEIRDPIVNGLQRVI